MSRRRRSGVPRRRGLSPNALRLAYELRLTGCSWVQIAAALRHAYPTLSQFAALRLAHCWSQSDAADEWNRRWPYDMKTFKNFSYWENWPSSTGYAPSLWTLMQLAEIYECAVADLVHGMGDFRHLDKHHHHDHANGTSHPAPSGQEMLARAAAHRPHLCVLDDIVTEAERWSDTIRALAQQWRQQAAGLRNPPAPADDLPAEQVGILRGVPDEAPPPGPPGEAPTRPRQARWVDRWLEAARVYHGTHGDLDVPADGEFTRLHGWLRRQKLAHRRGRIAPEIKEALDACGIDWEIRYKPHRQRG